MDNSDLKSLAHQFMINTLDVKSGDNVWVEYVGPKAKILAEACAQKIRIAGGNPHMVDSGADALNSTIKLMSDDEIKAFGKQTLTIMKTMQGYIRIRDDADASNIDLTDEQMSVYKKAIRPRTDYRVKNTNWLVVDHPTEEFATACGMSFSDFQQFYKNVCLLDYEGMSEAVKPLEKLMTEGKRVRIYSPVQETDLSFSIEGIPAIPCVGKRNIPDGECYTAPVKDSINGTITFGSSVYNNQEFQSIKLTIVNGRIEEATAENEERTIALNKILDTDDGARYFGEFAINFNPFIQKPTGSILFDEKIDGGIHLAAGSCYDEAYNGNKSAIHWDMVHIQRPEFGGGDLYIDDRLIRKDGIFVVPELEGLNPENLKVGNPNSQMSPD